MQLEGVQNKEEPFGRDTNLHPGGCVAVTLSHCEGMHHGGCEGVGMGGK